MIDSQTLIDAEKLVLSQAMDGTQAFTDFRDKGISHWGKHAPKKVAGKKNK